MTPRIEDVVPNGFTSQDNRLKRRYEIRVDKPDQRWCEEGPADSLPFILVSSEGMHTQPP